MAGPGTPTRAARVLIVEDDRLTARLLEFYLQDAGYETCLAPDVAEGLRQAELFVPDVILLDWQLPDGTGLDFLEHSRGKPTTVVVLSGTPTPEREAAARTVGAAAMWAKPLSGTELCERLVRLGIPSQI